MNRKERLEHYKKMLTEAKKASFKDRHGFCVFTMYANPDGVIMLSDLPELLEYKPKEKGRTFSFWFPSWNIWKRRRILKKIIRKMEKSDNG